MSDHSQPFTELVLSVKDLYRFADTWWKKVLVTLVVIFAIIVACVVALVASVVKWFVTGFGIASGFIAGVYIAVVFVCPFFGIDVIAMLTQLIAML